MRKTHAKRQKEYHQCLKSKNHEEYLRKDRERKKRQHELLKNSDKKYEQHKLKERQRKNAKKQSMTLTDPATSSSPNNSFQRNKHLEKIKQELRKIYLKAQEKKAKLYQPLFPVFLHLQKIMYLKPLEESFK